MNTALSVIGSSHPGATSKTQEHKELRSRMRASTNDGAEMLEQKIGEIIIQDLELLTDAGRLLAKKISDAPGMIFSQVQAVVEVGCGEYPGLGFSIASALMTMPNLKLKNSLKVVSLRWDDTEIPEFFKNSKNLAVLFVTPAKTPELTKKMKTSVDNFVSKVNAGVTVVGICSLVSLEEAAYEHIPESSNGVKKNSSPRFIEGLTIVE